MVYVGAMKVDIPSEITRRKVEIDRLQKEVDALSATARILGLALAVDLAIAAKDVSRSVEPTKPRGRQPGSISAHWRNVLAHWWATGEPASYERVHGYAKAAGIETELGSVRDRVRNFAAHGLVFGDADHGFKVTAEAAERFGFGKTNEAPACAEAPSNPAKDETGTSMPE